ncbi:MAG: carboxypeptidase M32 [Erysipelotrichaceae bacterium]|nr:carboxypeptidase M32 [Erysipelotrichaceae bacterium]
MNTKQAIKYYKDHFKKINYYQLMLNTVMYDKETVAPRKGNKERNEAIAYIDGELFSLETEPKFIEAVTQLSKEDLGKELNREIQLANKYLQDIIKFTKEESMAWEMARMESFDAWEKAKHTNNYKLFEPHLIKLINMSKERAKKRNPKISAYDLYLDDYEEGMTMKDYDKFFELIKKELLPLIKQVNANQDKVDDSFLYKYYPKDKQEKFMKDVLHFIGFDKGWGYMGVSEHPFTNGFTENDVRITTAYDEHNITACVFSIIHEVGHAYYEHQVDHKYQGTMIHKMISSGMHESQSRFNENYLGRRKSFWKSLYPKLQKYFPENLADVSLDDFIRAINASKSSLIRTDSDELTYPIHILIRYEIEKGIFEGKIQTKELNKLWNKKYKEYLGIDVPNDTKGILQDVHWSDANFGYFPTYALGSAIGAQLLNTMEKKIKIDELLEKNKFAKIEEYLKDNLQKYGALYDYNSLLKMVTGEKFNPKYYVNYLKNKYKKLYKIK